MDGGAWWAVVHGVTKSQTRLSDFTFIFTFMHWRKKWQHTPVFLPGESQGWGSPLGCCLWGRTELDMTEVMQQQQQQQALRYYIYNFFSFLILFINYLNSSLCEINFPQAFLQ